MFAQLTSWENLLLAYRKASKGKRSKKDVAAFEYRLEENLLQIQSELQSGEYSPGKYHSFYIHEPKRRLISAAPFRDRVVHHALCNLMEPIFETGFIDDCYANRIGKGTHRALDRAQQYSRKFRYCLQCDIRQFFPSLDHEILMGQINRKLLDRDALWLVSRILESGIGVLSEQYDMVYFPGDDLLAATRPRGLPIGNLTSQFWGNLYLNGFDHFVKRQLKCRGYLRYVDDFILFANEKKTLWGCKSQLEKRLAQLRLVIHPGAAPRPVEDGFTYLGFRIFPQERRLKRQKGIYFHRKLKGLAAQLKLGVITHGQLQQTLLGWVNHVRYGNTVGLRKAIFNSILVE